MTKGEAMRLWDEVRYSLLSRRHKEAVDIAFEALRAQMEEDGDAEE